MKKGYNLVLRKGSKGYFAASDEQQINTLASRAGDSCSISDFRYFHLWVSAITGAWHDHVDVAVVDY